MSSRQLIVESPRRGQEDAGRRENGDEMDKKLRVESRFGTSFGRRNAGAAN